METRTNKWRWKRVQMDADRQRFATTLLNASEELMLVHSYTNSHTLDDLMGDPVDCIESWFNTRCD